MRAFLQVIKGPGLGRKITLREGQLLYVGRTDQADVSCPENPEMSSVHFTIRWLGSECQFKDLNSANGSFRNGERIAETLVYDGDEIKTGQATFRVFMGDAAEGDTTRPEIPAMQLAPPLFDTKKEMLLVPAKAPGSGIAPSEHKTHSHAPHSQAAAATPAPSAPTASSVAGSIGLLIPVSTDVAAIAPIEDDNKKLASPSQSTPQFATLLANQEKFLDAIRVLAFGMGKLSAIEWSLRCVQTALGDGLSKVDARALEIVQRWLGEPGEDLRRAAYAAAQEAEHATPASWVAMAVFWSEGSMGPPPPAPVVPPGPTQCAHAATGAILLAAVARQPEKAPDRYREFVRIGLELVGGAK
ncbi:FHA domain protein [Anatilimnocola aggregata]|uniref:FHA domain protein n=1 Tax=Anatilimnocola aggregata TaxID=2528021 RepID=A0A517YJ25_9BACT|nr:FHA domain-containing protein [Anatilimnocola aggregata]QDU30211.1 FHA domain protein [Anatilimnocola aggregata]